MRVHHPVVRVTAWALVVWTAVVAASFYWSMAREKDQTLQLATNTARASFDKDQAYRRWAATHGGVYVFPDGRTPPNPYLAHLPERDLKTEDGRILTLMNPAYMLHQMMSEFSELYGIKGRITGLVYLNPDNRPDPWEADAIHAFQEGVTEVVELTDMEEAAYLRLMRPMEMEESCLKCHGHLGFKVGDVRGGVSVSVPLQPYLLLERQIIRASALAHTLIWLIGWAAMLLIALRARTWYNERQTHLTELTLISRVFERGLEGVLITDAQGVILRVNPMFSEITGYSAAEVVGKTPKILGSEHHDPAFFAAIWEALRTKGRWEGEIWNRRKNGQGFTAWETISSVTDDQGRTLNFVALFRDITEYKEREEIIHHLAHFDTLTGLANRTLLLDRLEHAIGLAQRLDRWLAVVFIDLDSFQNINDSLGHAAGDQILKQVSQRLQQVLRSVDTFARLGGDEFVVVLEELEREADMEEVIQRLLSMLAPPFDINGYETTITASIGISLFPKDGNNIETLIKHADTAMYRAKAGGKNTYRFYDEEMSRRITERFLLEGQLRRALEREQLVLHYQPQMDLASGTIVGVEALIRWQHPQMGLVQPDRFITLAEETGLIVPIGQWVLNTACAQAISWQRQGRPLRMAINISGEQFLRGGLVEAVTQALETSGCPASLIELEITESVMLYEQSDALDTLARLKTLGLSIALDDFGTGYSSLAYLKRLPIDRIKIDRSFIMGLPGDAEDRMLSTLILRIADSMGLSVIAEGIETPEQLHFLSDLKCPEVQGFLIARPLPPHDLAALFDSGRESAALKPN